MTNLITQNEKRYPDLKLLRQVVRDEIRPFKERWLSAMCYACIAVALKRKEVEC